MIEIAASADKRRKQQLNALARLGASHEAECKVCCSCDYLHRRLRVYFQAS